MATIYLGTCSWTDKSLIDSGRFYPPAVKTPEERLRFYAGIFPMVEVDSTYYAVPPPENAQRWVERTPDDFVFHVKAFRLFTGHWATPEVLTPDVRSAVFNAIGNKRRFYLHEVPARVQDALWTSYEDALLPLDSAGKLGVVLFQFAPWVKPEPRVLEHIQECQARLPQFKLAVELRNAQWFLGGRTNETLDFLRDRGITSVAVDEPQSFASSVPPMAEVTTDVAYVRFHGRNARTWEARTQTSAKRFDHWYTDDELGEWLPRIERLHESAHTVHLLFNTNNQDQGPQNARRLAQLLHDRAMDADVRNNRSILELPGLSGLL